MYGSFPACFVGFLAFEKKTKKGKKILFMGHF